MDLSVLIEHHGKAVGGHGLLELPGDGEAIPARGIEMPLEGLTALEVSGILQPVKKGWGSLTGGKLTLLGVSSGGGGGLAAGVVGGRTPVKATHVDFLSSRDTIAHPVYVAPPHHVEEQRYAHQTWRSVLLPPENRRQLDAPSKDGAGVRGGGQQAQGSAEEPPKDEEIPTKTRMAEEALPGGAVGEDLMAG